MPAERLQKIIAAAGVASRRKAEELITAGLVTVNGQTITELGAKADAAVDHIRVRGQRLETGGRKLYLMLNKPRGCVSTVHDPEGRATIMDLVRGVGARVFPIGRLDYNSEGLLLLTNDGDLAQRLTHASFHVPKTYLVKISGKPADEALNRLRGGVTIHEQHGGRTRQVRTSPARIELVRDAPNPWFEVTLTEGRNRQIHRMFEKVGHHVEKIKRIRYGPLALDVEPGRFRALTPAEVKRLQSGERAKPMSVDRAPSTVERRPQVQRAEGRGQQKSPRIHGDDRRPYAAQRPKLNDRLHPGRRSKIGDRRPAHAQQGGQETRERRPHFGQRRKTLGVEAKSVDRAPSMADRRAQGPRAEARGQMANGKWQESRRPAASQTQPRSRHARKQSKKRQAPRHPR